MEIIGSILSPLCPLGSPKPKHLRVRSQQNDSPNRALARKILRQWKQEVNQNTSTDCAALIQSLSRKNLPHVAQEIFLEMKSEGFPIDGSALSALMLCYADNNLFLEAQAIWDQILNSSFVPSIQIVSQLFDAYGRMGQFDEVIRILH